MGERQIMYRLCMILDKNGKEISMPLKDKFIIINKFVVGGKFSFTDATTGEIHEVKEAIIGVLFDNGFLVIKNENSTFCCVAVR